MGTGGEAGNQTFKGLEDKVSWVEKFLRVGAVGMEAAQNEHIRPVPCLSRPRHDVQCFGIHIWSCMRITVKVQSRKSHASFGVAVNEPPLHELEA